MITSNNYNNKDSKIVDFTTVDPTVWTQIEPLNDLIAKVRDASTIITNTGAYDRINWKSGYSDVLFWHTLNPQKAELLQECFEETFKGLEEGSAKEEIRQFILRNHFFIGTKSVSFDFSKTTLSCRKEKQFQELFNSFLVKVSTSLEKIYTFRSSTNKINNNIVVLTCNAGGGHKAVAESIAAYLQTKNYNIHILNVDEVPGDSIDEVTQGAVKTWHIFSKFRCQENNKSKADLYCDLRWELHKFIPGKSAHEVNKRIANLGADIILNTIHHEIQWISPLVDLKRPVCFINTDYELPRQLARLKTSVTTDEFKVLTPIEYPQNDTTPIGFPVRKGFEEKATEQEKQLLRKKFNILEDESMIVMQMGSLAMGVEKHLEEIVKSSHKLKNKCHFIFLCSDNQSASNAIQNFSKSLPENCKVCLHPIGKQNDSQLSLLYQASDYVLGKPGGATTAEIAATGAYLLAHNALAWEIPNLEYLKKRNQAHEINDFRDLVRLLNTDHIQKREISPVLDWKENILTVLKEFDQPKNEELKVQTPLSINKIENIFLRYLSNSMRSFRSFWAFFKIVRENFPLSIISWMKLIRRAKNFLKYS